MSAKNTTMLWFLLFTVCPKPRTIPVTVINKSMKTRLQSIVRRVRHTFISAGVNTSCVIMVHHKLSQCGGQFNQKKNILREGIFYSCMFEIGSRVVSTVASQQEGCWFDSIPGPFYVELHVLPKASTLSQLVPVNCPKVYVWVQIVTCLVLPSNKVANFLRRNHTLVPRQLWKSAGEVAIKKQIDGLMFGTVDQVCFEHANKMAHCILDFGLFFIQPIQKLK